MMQYFGWGVWIGLSHNKTLFKIQRLMIIHIFDGEIHVFKKKRVFLILKLTFSILYNNLLYYISILERKSFFWYWDWYFKTVCEVITWKKSWISWSWIKS